MNLSDVDRELERLRMRVLGHPSVVDAEIREGKLRVYLEDESYMDVWVSRKLGDRYAVHWERRHVDGTIYRWDNTPHEAHKSVSTFPHHFHDGSDENVGPSEFTSLEDLMDRVMVFVEEKIGELKRNYQASEEAEHDY